MCVVWILDRSEICNSIEDCILFCLDRGFHFGRGKKKHVQRPEGLIMPAVNFPTFVPSPTMPQPPQAKGNKAPTGSGSGYVRHFNCWGSNDNHRTPSPNKKVLKPKQPKKVQASVRLVCILLVWSYLTWALVLLKSLVMKGTSSRQPRFSFFLTFGFGSAAPLDKDDSYVLALRMNLCWRCVFKYVPSGDFR